MGLFGFVFLLQLGHLIEHIVKAITGSGLLGRAADNELSHLTFNVLIALLAVVVVYVHPRNPWAYPLVALSLLHGVEHIYIYREFLHTGVSDGPGLFGLGGAIGIIPLDRTDLHNIYNGLEAILMTLGCGFQVEVLVATFQER